MKCIIIDDEPLAREGIELYIEETDFLTHIGSFENPIKAGPFIQENDVDLIFLDIQMPGMTGIDFLKMMPLHPLVIFTTAYAEYALESYELDVLDYLLKPITPERFQKAVLKAKDIYEISAQRNDKTIESVEADYFFIRANREYVKLFFEDILYIRGMKDYVLIKTKTDKFMTAMNVKTALEQLPDSIFCRISKSYIINANHATNVSTETLMILDEELPIGRVYKDDFVNRFIKPKLIDRKN